MIVSLNEIETTCYRAALGAGLSHGLAEDAAMIGARLLITHPDGLAIMLRALAFTEANNTPQPPLQKEGGVWRSQVRPLPSLVVGPLAADLLKADPSCRLEIEADEPLILAVCLEDRPLLPPPAAITVPENQWQEIQSLAARTYVPQSETSRLKGAGAGLMDSD